MQRSVNSSRSRSPRHSALAWGCIASILACSPGSEVDDGVTVEREPAPDASMGGVGPGEPPTPGQSLEELLYLRPPPPDCADFDKGDDEACDDGNRLDGDGCSSNCLVIETGYVCEQPGQPCELVELCGDGRRVLSEGCDDGNSVAGDGCASNCQLESGYSCPTPGQLCVSTLVCGDGFIALGESCDDGNQTPGDGCSEACALETGWQCLIPNAKCTPLCGDGLLTGGERCDDAGAATPGCSAACRLEPGFVCKVPGQACEPTDCLDGDVEGSEQCDDANLAPYDGCSTICTNEPRCGYEGDIYTCGAVCGDGMKFPEEACDDGNNQPDDGCSPECELELGYACLDQAAELGTVLPLPIIYRDFSNTHPQFEIDPLQTPRLPGIVQAQLGANGKPVYNPDFTFAPQGRPWTMDGPAPAAPGLGKVASGAATLSPAQIAQSFAEWYTDVPGQNQTFFDILDLNVQGDDSFQFSASGATQFFPIDGLGFGDQGNDEAGLARNFHFTSEARQWFQFQGGELLEFSGDDDVWVFVNGQLTVDLGGIHGEIIGSIELSEDGAGSELCVQDTVGAPVVCSQIDVPVSPNVNEIVVFQAERHVTQSNYTLTLRGFNAPITTCQSVCGDGELTPDETCDDGELNGTGYNRCSLDCTPGPRCGDGFVEAGVEQCDNGANQDGYVVSEASCAPGCLTPSRCGDGVIDASFGEQCDDGVNDNAYGGCSPECLLGPRCGDGVVQVDEGCDDGNRRNTDGCNVNCRVERAPA